MPKKPKLVENLARGTRIEVVWDDAYVPGGDEDGERDDPHKAIKCYDMGYFDSLDSRGLRLWREIDEYGEFRWEMNIARSSILKVRRLGPAPRLATKGPESA